MWSRLSLAAVLVSQNRDVGPRVVVERVPPTALDVRLDEVLIGAVLQARVGDVGDELLAGGLVISDGLRAGLGLRLLDRGVDARIADAVVVAATNESLRADEDVVEPVLWVVVVGAPAVTEEDVLLVLARGQERREVRALGVDVDTEVGLPLRLQVVRDRLVRGAGVVPVDQPLLLGAGRVPGGQVSLRLGGVEHCRRILVSTEVSLRALRVLP